MQITNKEETSRTIYWAIEIETKDKRELTFSMTSILDTNSSWAEITNIELTDGKVKSDKELEEIKQFIKDNA